MPSKKPFGFEFFSPFFLFLFLILSLYFPIIKALVHLPITLPLPLDLNISTFVIILFATTLPTVPSVPTGYLLPTYLLISSRNLCLTPSLYVIVLLLALFSFNFFPYFI